MGIGGIPTLISLYFATSTYTASPALLTKLGATPEQLVEGRRRGQKEPINYDSLLGACRTND